jgi:magnesium-transporting ATPase (P-type)
MKAVSNETKERMFAVQSERRLTLLIVFLIILGAIATVIYIISGGSFGGQADIRSGLFSLLLFSHVVPKIPFQPS